MINASGIASVLCGLAGHILDLFRDVLISGRFLFWSVLPVCTPHVRHHEVGSNEKSGTV